MRVLLTGANGLIGTAVTEALAGRHELRVTDVVRPGALHGQEFVEVDVRDPDQISAAAEGVDAVIHTPAWHGIHTGERTEREFWELNVDGTFNALRAAVANDVGTFVFLSSQAYHGGVGGKYAMTKLIGETVCEYFVRNHEGFSAIAVRPAACIPPDDRKALGERLLRNPVDLRDVVGVIRAALENETIEWGAYPAIRDDPFTEAELDQWPDDPIGVLEGYVDGAGDLVETYDLDLPDEINYCGGHARSTMEATREDLGYQGQYDFVWFLQELKAHDEQGDAEAWLAGPVDEVS